MRKCYKNIKNKIALFAICLICFSSFANGKSVALIHHVKGNVFAIHEGRTWTVKSGQVVPDMVEIYTEEGGQVTFSDYYDHKFHLAGSGHVKIFNNLIDLKNGYLWYQVLKNNIESHIQTANSKLSYAKGEGIVSFDAVDGKTQVLTIKGKATFSNSLEEFMKVTLREGHFSFISKDHENGRPRNSTPIGFSSFKKVTSLFYKVSPLENSFTGQQVSWMKEVDHRGNSFRKTNPKEYSDIKFTNTSSNISYRKPASKVSDKRSESLSKNIKKGIVLRKIPPTLKMKKFDLDNFYSKELKTVKKENQKIKAKLRLNGPSGVNLKIYGKKFLFNKSNLNKVSKSKRNSTRTPASLKKSQSVKSSIKLNPQVIIRQKGDFESTLTEHFKLQMRHEKEVNSLINDLKNYDQDYKQNY